MGVYIIEGPPRQEAIIPVEFSLTSPPIPVIRAVNYRDGTTT
jgi:hypothetical protein